MPVACTAWHLLFCWTVGFHLNTADFGDSAQYDLAVLTPATAGARIPCPEAKAGMTATVTTLNAAKTRLEGQSWSGMNGAGALDAISGVTKQAKKMSGSDTKPTVQLGTSITKHLVGRSAADQKKIVKTLVDTFMEQLKLQSGLSAAQGARVDDATTLGFSANDARLALGGSYKSKVDIYSTGVTVNVEDYNPTSPYGFYVSLSKKDDTVKSAAATADEIGADTSAPEAGSLFMKGHNPLSSGKF